MNLGQKNFIASVLFLSSIFSTESNAGGFTFGLTNCNLSNGASICASAQSVLNSIFAQSFNDTLFTNFLSAGGNANAASSRSNFAPGVIGDHEAWVALSVDAGVQLPSAGSGSTGSSTNALPSLGLGLQGFVTIGFPSKWLHTTLGLPVDPNRLSLSISAGALTSKFSSTVNYSFYHLGLGGSYQYITEKKLSFLAAWEGVRISSGLTYSHTNLHYSTPIKMQTGDLGGGVTALWNSTADLGFNSNIITIPIEVITGVELLRIWSIYGGLAMNINLGSTSFDGSLSGPVTATGSGTGSATVSAVADASSAPPTTVQLGVTLGTQIAIGPGSIHLQASYFNPKVATIQLGLAVQI
jgi:hypothetical protein